MFYMERETSMKRNVEQLRGIHCERSSKLDRFRSNNFWRYYSLIRYVFSFGLGNVSRNQVIKVRERVFTDFDPNFFWKWTDFQSYLDFILLFAAFMGILTYLLVDVPAFVETIGLLAVLMEAMLGIPQFLCNFFNKSTNGMSIVMVGLWTLGDAFKTCYFVVREAPIQFEVCGALQVIIDIAILAQVYIYQNSSAVHAKVPVRVD
ncbi:PQ-loop repeat-containing protein 1 isoform X3 [Ceratina calcarata]|uniref:PQ-loop repeat-containing protein 1 isoform X3 n=1 Tax=Ceratina calcarata TaxID=156304 RepID=A0AAJ7SAK7_9HYME|nr:PQ-loop repeat-containing protein 1 isoform X3 [Ceratina calcarata]